MLKLNLRSLFLVLGVVILLIVSASCNNSDNNSLNSAESVQGSEEQQELGVENGELWTKIQAQLTTADNKSATFRAEPYIQSPELSWEYSLNIEIENDKIYINDVLYKESSSVPPAILYSAGFLSHADYTDGINGTEIASTLTEIKNCKSCYPLEAEQGSKAGQTISVYEIDDVLYFVSFFDNGEVMRIHRSPIA